MERIVKIKESRFLQSLTTKVRNKETDSVDLQDLLFEIGRMIGVEIVGEEFTKIDNITTPMNDSFQGLSVTYKNIMIIGTRDDFEFFLKGLAKIFPNADIGYMDFNGQRGVETYTAGIRSLVIPDTPQGTFFDALIIAKSVLATGCTAVSLAKEALDQIMPSKLIIASCFYSERAIKEVHDQLPQAKLYLVGEPDTLNDDGMLVPGVGNIDDRLKSS